MIKNIHLQNFLGFKDTEISLEEGENVFVGINGSGKTNFFEAIKLLKEGVAGEGLTNLIMKEWGGFNTIFNYNAGKDDHMYLSFSFKDNIFKSNDKVIETGDLIEYSVILDGIGIGIDYIVTQEFLASPISNSHQVPLLSFQDGSGDAVENGAVNIKRRKKGSYRWLRLANVEPKELGLPTIYSQNNTYVQYVFKEYIKQISLYRFNTALDGGMRESVYAGLDKVLAEDGSNLSIVLSNLKHTDRAAFKLIERSLNLVNENYEQIEFANRSSGSIELMLVEKGLNKSTSILNISDGTLRFLCLMAILYNPNRGKIVCIDEPELGLHPDMINTLYRAIEHAAKTSQVIIATHSAHLLDYFNLKNIRVFEKNEHNETIIEQFGEEDFKGWYQQFNPGQMWRAGDIGGKRW